MSSKKTSHSAREPPIIGTIYSIPAAELHPRPDNPYGVRDDPGMLELIESVKQYGVLTPIEVRPMDSGGYELIAGARRKYACELAGIEHIPAIVLNLDDDDAIIRLVDTNIQRENVLYSERAKAYKMRMEAMKRKAGRPAKQAENNSPNYSANFRSDDALGEALGISGDTVRNIISLNNLVPDLMQMVDIGRIALTPAYHIATLSPDEQALLVDTIGSEQATPSVSQAQKMQRLSRTGDLNEDTMLEIMMVQKKPIKNDITLPGDRLRKYFPKTYTPKQIEDKIFQLLDLWLKKRQRDQSR